MRKALSQRHVSLLSFFDELNMKASAVAQLVTQAMHIERTRPTHRWVVALVS
jgi:hypothetical protein